MSKLRERSERKVDTLEDRLGRKQRDLAQHEADVQAKMATEAVNVGETLLSMFFGRRRSLTTAVSKRTQTRKAQDKVSRTTSEITEIEREIYDLQAELEDEIRAIQNEELRDADDIEVSPIGLEKSDIRVDAFVVLWVPVSRPV